MSLIPKPFIIAAMLIAWIHSPCWALWHNYHNQQPTFSIMIDPAGDAHTTGRTIDDSLERGITLQCAERLKTELEQRYPSLRVVLTRFPGETLQPLQNAAFANRLDVNLYVSIHFYQEHATKPAVYIYHFSYADPLPKQSHNLVLYSYDKAYLPHAQTTKQWALLCKKVFEKDPYKKQFDIKGVFALPFKPLIGITSPAIAFEAGLKHKDDWTLYVTAFADSLEPLINTITPVS